MPVHTHECKCTHITAMCWRSRSLMSHSTHFRSDDPTNSVKALKKEVSAYRKRQWPPAISVHNKNQLNNIYFTWLVVSSDTHINWKSPMGCRFRTSGNNQTDNHNLLIHVQRDYYYYYAAFNAPCVGHKADESQIVANEGSCCSIPSKYTTRLFTVLNSSQLVTHGNMFPK